MADAVTSRVLVDRGSEYTILLTNLSDGTGEAAVKKVDISTLVGRQGGIPTAVKIRNIAWVTSFPYVKLAFDHNTDDMGLLLTGSGELSFERIGGLTDPASAGGTGDILLTAPSSNAGAVYTIILTLEK